jgi:hypothetical protein
VTEIVLEESEKERAMGEQSEKVKAVLFPPEEPRGDNGTVDHSADHNLEAVIINLERRGADKVCIGTLNAILMKLTAARAILDAAP